MSVPYFQYSEFWNLRYQNRYGIEKVRLILYKRNAIKNNINVQCDSDRSNSRGGHRKKTYRSHQQSYNIPIILCYYCLLWLLGRCSPTLLQRFLKDFHYGPKKESVTAKANACLLSLPSSTKLLPAIPTTT